MRKFTAEMQKNTKQEIIYQSKALLAFNKEQNKFPLFDH